MYAMYLLLPIPLIFCVCQNAYMVQAQHVVDELNTCEEQLARYRRFLLQAILSFEDVCDIYDSHTLNPLEALYKQDQPDAVNMQLMRALHASTAAAEQQSEIWAFFKLLMAQFNDMEFANIIKDAVIERCHAKSQLQHDEKRNSVVLGKKQRFHSWGGKRSHFGGAGGIDGRSLDLM